MASRRVNAGSSTSRGSAPPTTAFAREQQLASYAYDLAEAQLKDGTASSQVMTHFLKMGSSREVLEQERMRHEISLMEAKKEHMQTLERQEELFASALLAMTIYTGEPVPAIEE
jgi:TRAP-type uncharacterized transport system substrate-binding protein